jgi:hypothetical protein
VLLLAAVPVEMLMLIRLLPQPAADLCCCCGTQPQVYPSSMDEVYEATMMEEEQPFRVAL